MKPARDPLTYRHPRTLVEAFGPDASSAVAIHGPYTDHSAPMHPADRIVCWACAAGAVALVLFAGQGWI